MTVGMLAQALELGLQATPEVRPICRISWTEHTWVPQVDCCTRQGTSWVGPSERLAKMMMKHESKLGQRLKGYVEAGQRSVYVC